MVSLAAEASAFDGFAVLAEVINEKRFACSVQLRFSGCYFFGARQAVSATQTCEATANNGVHLFKGEKEALSCWMAAFADKVIQRS
jgi:hypothetical protein